MGSAAGRSVARPQLLEGPPRPRARLQAGRPARSASSTPTTRSSRRSISSASTPTPTSPRRCSRSSPGAIDRYEELKARSRRARLPRPAAQGARPGARQRRRPPRLPARFTHIFVDEFQDTDPLQAEILLLLASADPGAGRLAPASLPSRAASSSSATPSSRSTASAAPTSASTATCASGWSRPARRACKLTTSFRSVPQIQACVNAAFAPVMTGDAARCRPTTCRCRRYRAEHQGAARGRRAAGAGAVRRPQPVGDRRSSSRCPTPSARSSTGSSTRAAGRSSGTAGRAGAATSASSSGASSASARTSRSPTSARWRRAASITSSSAASPSTTAKKSRRSAPRCPRSSGRTTSWRCSRRCGARCSRSATKSCWSGSSASACSIRSASRSPTPAPTPEPPASSLQHLQPDRRRACACCSTCIAGATTGRWPRRSRSCSTRRGRTSGIVLRSAGEQALANVLHVAELAREYEAGGGLSFRGFVDELREAAENAQAGEAPILEEGSDGVRMMTVHKAKGLEFPIVILADLTCKLARAEAGRWLDPEHNVCALKIGGWAPIDLLLHDAEEAARDRAESERLTYVAATRARDILVVPAIGDAPYDGGWLDPLMPAIYPPRAGAPRPAKARRRARLQVEGHRPAPSRRRSRDAEDRRARHLRVLDRGPRSHRPRSSTPRDSADYPVTWWDPRALAPRRRVVVRPAPRRSDRQGRRHVRRRGSARRLRALARRARRRSSRRARAERPHPDRHRLGRGGREARDRRGDCWMSA